MAVSWHRVRTVASGKVNPNQTTIVGSWSNRDDWVRFCKRFLFVRITYGKWELVSFYSKDREDLAEQSQPSRTFVSMSWLKQALPDSAVGYSL